MGTRRRLRVGDRIPNLRLPRIGGGQEALRGPSREAVVVVAMHDPACDRCLRYLRALEGERERFALWDGRVHALVPTATPIPHPDRYQGAGRILVDGERELLDRVDAAAGPVTLVADRYGQIYTILTAGPEHALVEPRELEEWLQYLATQCPE